MASRRKLILGEARYVPVTPEDSVVAVLYRLNVLTSLATLATECKLKVAALSPVLEQLCLDERIGSCTYRGETRYYLPLRNQKTFGKELVAAV